MSDTDSMMQRFRGPTPPPALDKRVLQAAADKAAAIGTGQGPRLSAEAEMSYSSHPGNRPKTEQVREQTAMSDNIVFPCPACGTKYSVSPHHAGKKTTCKKCSAQVTVPTPQVANPTIVGGTRTIRRADIDPGHSAREEAVANSGGEVDMTGGASVLRKEETVIGAPPMHATSVPTRGAPRRPTAASGRPAPQPHGRPMPYGAPAGGARKNNMPLLLGIGGGVLGLILVVIIIVVAASGPSGNTATDGGATAADGSGTGGPKVDPDQKLLADHKKQMNSVTALGLAEVRNYYLQADERKDKPEWKSMRKDWARELNKKAVANATPDELAEIAIMLDDAQFVEGRQLLDQAWRALKNANKATREVTVSGRKTSQPNPKFVTIVTRLGWKSYKRPAQMDLCETLECDGAAEYRLEYSSIEDVYHMVELYPPELVEKLSKLEKQALEGYAALVEADKDGWAIKSRQAWIRFKNAQNNKAKVDRVKGKRSFSPLAMERESEDFDSIWTYTYGPSFMVFVEKPIGQSNLDEDFLETLESKKALLSHLYNWFNEHLITRYNLQRQKPKDNAAIAQEEGWPMEIVVLKDSATFEKYATDVMGQPMPGARAFYSPLDERVMTYDDTENADPDTAWFNESVLIHETFHMLSDFYGANPVFSMEELQQRPRYTSILVQEGLTDSVSGFVRGGGQGRDATYEFLQLNHIRLRDFKAIYEMLGKKPLFRIRDTLECRHYGQVRAKGVQRAQEEKMKVNLGWIANSVAMGMFYATSCQISYFFENYKEGSKYPYRDKWWEFVGLDYKGDIDLSSYDDNSGITKFKDMFGIKSDKDWDDLEKKFMDYTLALTPENVGKGGEIIKEDGKEESMRPGIPTAPGLGHDGSEMPALPNREEEAALVG